jgi:hypothetical protein
MTRKSARDFELFYGQERIVGWGHLANSGRAAETSGCHRPHSQAARALDSEESRFLRRRRRPSWSPPYLHQHRQAPDLRVHLLRRAICECRRSIRPSLSFTLGTNQKQAHEHHRKHLQSLPSTPYPLEAPNDPATLPASDFETLNAKTGSTEPYQSATGKPLEQR